ncbi:MAG TPA: hypothetical protein DCY13_19455 [Verrucomicrobiales bacterium]|nr:hypothetical protein [Verrucomicrobiales bacterium]
MKTPIVHFAAGILLFAAGFSSGQEGPASGRLSATPDTPQETPAVSNSGAPSEVGFVSGPIIDERMLAELANSTNVTIIQAAPEREDRVDFQRVRVEGGVTPVIKQPTFVRFLQLFNPFAPAEFGGLRERPQGTTLSRAFHDPIKSQPASALISIGERPAAAKGEEE